MFIFLQIDIVVALQNRKKHATRKRLLFNSSYLSGAKMRAIAQTTHASH